MTQGSERSSSGCSKRDDIPSCDRLSIFFRVFLHKSIYILELICNTLPCPIFHMESMWNMFGSIWNIEQSPYGIEIFHGFHMEWALRFHLDSMFIPCTHSTWNRDLE